MTLKHWLVGAAGALAVGTLSASVQAAPLGTAPDSLKATAEETAVQDVVWVRRCWWHRGHRHCRRVWRDSGYYYDPGYYHDPYPYSDGFFFGPSIGFSFDGGHRHHHHRGGHHRHR